MTVLAPAPAELGDFAQLTARESTVIGVCGNSAIDRARVGGIAAIVLPRVPGLVLTVTIAGWRSATGSASIKDCARASAARRVNRFEQELYCWAFN
jgi:hypothetical protein